MKRVQPVGALAYYPCLATIELLVALMPKKGFALFPPDDISDETLIASCMDLLEAVEGLTIELTATEQAISLLTMEPENIRTVSERLQARFHEGRLLRWEVLPV